MMNRRQTQLNKLLPHLYARPESGCVEPETLASHIRAACALKLALRAERSRKNHWSYSGARAAALVAALRQERAAVAGAARAYALEWMDLARRNGAFGKAAWRESLAFRRETRELCR